MDSRFCFSLTQLCSSVFRTHTKIMILNDRLGDGYGAGRRVFSRMYTRVQLNTLGGSSGHRSSYQTAHVEVDYNDDNHLDGSFVYVGSTRSTARTSSFHYRNNQHI